MNYEPSWEQGSTIPVVVAFELIEDLVDGENLSFSDVEVVSIAHNDLGAYILTLANGGSLNVLGTDRIGINTTSRPTRSRQ